MKAQDELYEVAVNIYLKRLLVIRVNDATLDYAIFDSNSMVYTPTSD